MAEARRAAETQVEETQEQQRKQQRVATFASSAVQLGAALLLGGGFYYGVAKQKRVVKEEKLLPGRPTGDKTPVIRATTFLERRLALDRPLEPNVAAWKALVGGTVVSVSGCFVLVCGLAAVMGVRSVSEFRERMEDGMSRMRKGVTQTLNIKPKQRNYGNEAAEMRELEAIFKEEAEPKPSKTGSKSK